MERIDSLVFSNALKQLEHEVIRTGPHAREIARDYDLESHSVWC